MWVNKKSLVVTGVLQDFGPCDPFSHCDIFLNMKMMKSLLQSLIPNLHGELQQMNF